MFKSYCRYVLKYTDVKYFFVIYLILFFYSQFGGYIKSSRSVDVRSFHADLRKKNNSSIDVYTILNWLDNNWIVYRHNVFMSRSIHIRSGYR